MAVNASQLFQYIRDDNQNGVRGLLDQGMNPNRVGQRIPIFYALAKGRNEIAKMLINQPTFNVNQYSIGFKAGFAPLHIAIDKNMADVVKLLLEKGANVNIRTNNMIHTTPLHLAVTNFPPNYEIIDLLLSNGADRTIMDYRDHTPEDSARDIGDDEHDQVADYIRDWAELPELKEPADYLDYDTDY